MKEPREVIAENMASTSVFDGTAVEYLQDADEIIAALNAAGYAITAESQLSLALVERDKLQEQSNTWQSAAEMRETQLDDLANQHRAQIEAIEKDHRRDIIKIGGERDRAREAGRKILAKLDHPTASVTQWDADELRDAIKSPAPIPAQETDR